MKSSDKMLEAIERAMDAMSQEDLLTLIEEDKNNRCFPDSCHGSCQGMGWCYLCEDFRDELTEDYMEDLMA